ncbi:putative oxidoreductase [Streptomyces viridiviolaceus]|uniref:NAD(P)/FAD-dependent oxidoreductase n=1 Tax=Streptomyces viridiviolaceus TaxID=68282 RepID=A0ABW2DTN2_9ACTN|nr:FAD-binding oxidoreductase [Streptomyces viridiviolaceus]GHB32640.1 putative oxidoreductase [Streptomyces viridiviolaceus]
MTSTEVVYSEFGWADPPDDVTAALEGEVTCDIAVVGGGYAGMAAALRLAERGADVVLLEAGFCGCGASSRNAGQLGSVPGGDPQLLSALHPRRFQGLVRLAEEAVDFTEKLIDRHGIDCEYEQTGNVAAAVSPGQLRIAKKKAEIFQKAGVNVEFGDGRDLGLPDAFLGGMLEPVGGVMDPGKFALGLRKALLASDVKVYEQTPAKAVEPTSVGVIVAAPRGHVRAEKVVLATNAYSRELSIAPKRLAAPIWVSMIETEPVDRLEATGWTSRSGLATQHSIMESYRPTRRNTIVTGVRQLQVARGTVGARKPDPAVVSDITDGFRSRFPALRDIAIQRAWGGWIAMTPSWLPVAGDVARNVSYLIACNGHGLAQAPYLGTLLADRLVDGKGHDDLDTVWRQRPRFAPALVFNAPVMRTMWACDRRADRKIS